MAKYITKVKEDVPAAKDRGGPGIYEEMIKTWVLYELVKVLYLFGLNPGIIDYCESAAPEIYQYLFDMEHGGRVHYQKICGAQQYFIQFNKAQIKVFRQK